MIERSSRSNSGYQYLDFFCLLSSFEKTLVWCSDALVVIIGVQHLMLWCCRECGIFNQNIWSNIFACRQGSCMEPSTQLDLTAPCQASQGSRPPQSKGSLAHTQKYFDQLFWSQKFQKFSHSMACDISRDLPRPTPLGWIWGLPHQIFIWTQNKMAP